MSINTSQSAGSVSETIRAKIFGDHYVEIRKTHHHIPWAEEVHAVNWFNTRAMFVYNFYNLIAGRSVAGVGGKPIFKGRLTKTLYGSQDDSRGVLLVVKYPSAQNFCNMLENLYFKVVSVFRTVAVSDFTFCLTKATTVATFAHVKMDSYSYLVHHFRGNEQTLTSAKQVTDGTRIELMFSSVKSHSIVSVAQNQPDKPIPDVMDGILLFRSNNDASLEDFVASNNYQVVVESTDTSSIGLLRRLM